MHVVTRKTLFAPCISAETARACDGNTAFLIAPKFRQSTVTYQQLGNQGYQHGTVNHTIQFVNNGVTTNHVESFWSRVKRRLKYVYGSSGDLQWSHLDEAQYRLWFGWTASSVFANWQMFLHHVRQLYTF